MEILVIFLLEGSQNGSLLLFEFLSVLVPFLSYLLDFTSSSLVLVDHLDLLSLEFDEPVVWLGWGSGFRLNALGPNVMLLALEVSVVTNDLLDDELIRG